MTKSNRAVRTTAVRGADTQGELLGLEDGQLRLRLECAYAPGTPVTVHGDGFRFEFKCLRSRKLSPKSGGTGFEVLGKLGAVPKPQRDKLEALLLAASD